MIKMIHRTTGVEMWVHEKKVREYLERGHSFAPVPIPESKKTPAKTPIKRKAKK